MTFYSALQISPRFDPPDIALSGDALVKLYAAAYRDAVRSIPALVHEIRDNAAEARAANPGADVSEVTVVLADGEHHFTWDEFTAWLDEGPAA